MLTIICFGRCLLLNFSIFKLKAPLAPPSFLNDTIPYLTFAVFIGTEILNP